MNSEPAKKERNDGAGMNLRGGLMDSIRAGKLHMRPRWHFVMLSASAALGACLVALSLLYIASLTAFFLHDSGAWLVPSFGGRGWYSFLRAMPWLLLLLSLLCIGILEASVQRYRFIYCKPVSVSLLAIVGLAVFGGTLIAATPFHRQMRAFAARNELPMPFSLAYAAPLRAASADMYHGSIAAMTPDGFVLYDENGGATTTIRIVPATRLPAGEDFRVGMRVVVVGDAFGSSTVTAFGIRQSEE